MSITFRYEPCRCPICGSDDGEATILTYGDGTERRRAGACGRCEAAACERLRLFTAELLSRWPTLSTRTARCLGRAFSNEKRGMDLMLAATDDDLLALLNFGKHALAEVRAVIPAPVPPPREDPKAIDRFWAQRHDVLSIVGG